MKPSFFNLANRQFWGYHLSALGLITIVQAFVIILWRNAKLFNSVAGLAWALLFTLSVLCYRYYYKKHLWEQLGAVQHLWRVFISSIVAGLSVTCLMLALVVPFFWAELLALPELVSKTLTPESMIIQMIIGNSLQTQLFYCLWAFIYIGTTNSRRTRTIELNNLRLQNSLKEAQLANLANQLNPHFLFNALNNIRFSIFESPQKAETMLTELAELLRYSLESNQKDKVTLEQELTVTRRYLGLIKVQMEQRLQYSEQIDSKLLDKLVPPMVLQLLVENAIKHGLEKIRHGGTLSIIAEATSDQLHITVINSHPQANPSPPPEGIGMGLNNILARLRLLYGSNALLHQQQDAQEFKVLLQIPLERAA